MIEALLDRSRFQESIFRSLQRAEPALADLYEGARQLATTESPLPGQTWFVGHAIREIVDHVPELSGVDKHGGVNYVERLREVAAAWEAHGLVDDANEPQPACTQEVAGEAIAVVASLVRDNRRHRNRRDRLQAAFAARAPHVGPARHQAWAKECHNLYDENATRSHTGKPWPAPGDDRKAFRNLEIILAGIFGEYAPNRQELDAILARANRRRD